MKLIPCGEMNPLLGLWMLTCPGPLLFFELVGEEARQRGSEAAKKRSREEEAGQRWRWERTSGDFEIVVSVARGLCGCLLLGLARCVGRYNV